MPTRSSRTNEPKGSPTSALKVTKVLCGRCLSPPVKACMIRRLKSPVGVGCGDGFKPLGGHVDAGGAASSAGGHGLLLVAVMGWQLWDCLRYAGAPASRLAVWLARKMLEIPRWRPAWAGSRCDPGAADFALSDGRKSQSLMSLPRAPRRPTRWLQKSGLEGRACPPHAADIVRRTREVAARRC